MLWYSFGFTHVTRPEDYPIMPAGRVSVNFAPKAFFQKSPALGRATLEKGQPRAVTARGTACGRGGADIRG